MAYSGYLVKVGTYTIPFKFIKAETFQAVYSVNDLDSYRDANGELHRTALPRRTLKVEWETPDMSGAEIQELLTNIRSMYINANEKSAYVTAYMPEKDAYVTDKCYLSSDVNFTIRYADATKLRFEPIRFAFIGYTTANAT